MTTKKKKLSFLCVLVPVVCALVYVFLCTLNLTSSIWFDEAYSAYLVRGNFAEIWSLTAADVHPPLFYFLLKIWSLVFGNSIFAMRFMSVFFGAISIIVLFYLLKRWFGKKPAVISTALISLSPMLIRYGQEMRMYTVVFLIVILATYVLDLAIETNKKRYYILYAVLVSLGMWTHYFTAIAWLTHLAYIRFVKKQKIFQKKWLLTYGGAVLLYIPWIPSFISQVTEVQKGFWIPPVSMVTLGEYISQSLLFMTADTAAGWFVLLIVATLALTIVLCKRAYSAFDKAKKSHFWLLTLLTIMPPALLVIFSMPPLSSMFVDRYVTYAAAFIWALVGVAISFGLGRKQSTSAKSSHAPAIILLLCMVASAVVGIINVENRWPEGYVKDIVEVVDSMADIGEPILVNNEWTYYDAIFYSTSEHPIYVFDSQVSYQYGSIFPIRQYHYNVIDDSAEFIKSTDKLWYIADPGEELPENLKSKYRIVTEATGPSHVAFELEKL